MTKKQLTDVEVNNIISLQNQYAQLIAELGQIELNILVLEKQIEKIKTEEKETLWNKLLNVQEQEKALATELSAKYGTGKIDLPNKEIIID
jgi:hypothetical protein